MQYGERHSAQDVLADVPLWRLKPAGWHAVGRALQAMHVALAAGDDAGLRRAVADLELAGPYRIGGLQDTEALPLPQKYRERVNELIHTLGATPPRPPQTAPATTGRSARAPVTSTPVTSTPVTSAEDRDAEGFDAAG